MGKPHQLRWTIALLGTVLAGALALAVIGSLRPRVQTFHGRVAELLPTATEVPGWSMADMPVADTPEMQKKVGELLSYDGAVFRTYTRGADHLAIYVAYWTPGKMSHRLVAGHTPDVCWVGGGWTVASAGTHSFPLAVPGVSVSPASPEEPWSAPAEVRSMVLNGSMEQVAFFHRVGRSFVSYQTVGKPPWYAALADLLKHGLDQREEQFFIRFSSNLPVESWPSLAPFQLAASRLPIVATDGAR